MAKDKKAPLASQGKPITAFFALANKTSKSPAATSPNASLLHTSLLSRVGSPQAREEPNKWVSTKLTGGPMSGVTLRRSDRGTHLQAATSLKRGRTPDSPLKPPTNSNRHKAHARHKNKFETDSEDDTNDAVIYVNSVCAFHSDCILITSCVRHHSRERKPGFRHRQSHFSRQPLI